MGKTVKIFQLDFGVVLVGRVVRLARVGASVDPLGTNKDQRIEVTRLHSEDSGDEMESIGAEGRNPTVLSDNGF